MKFSNKAITNEVIAQIQYVYTLLPVLLECIILCTVPISCRFHS